jgi:low affinity Fe/Cu permease
MQNLNKSDSPVLNEKEKKDWFESFANKATHIAGSTISFVSACILIVAWIITGPLFHFSDTWQLVINTGTTIITFLMVFLIQKTQNKDSIVMQIKLNELIAASEKASNRIVDIEALTEEELKRLHEYYSRLAEITKKEKNLKKSHSIEDTNIPDISHPKMNKKQGEVSD